jgi:hypothetical protein
MAATAETGFVPARRRHPIEMIGGWEAGLLVFMLLLYWSASM